MFLRTCKKTHYLVFSHPTLGYLINMYLSVTGHFMPVGQDYCTWFGLYFSIFINMVKTL